MNMIDDGTYKKCVFLLFIFSCSLANNTSLYYLFVTLLIMKYDLFGVVLKFSSPNNLPFFLMYGGLIFAILKKLL